MGQRAKVIPEGLDASNWPKVRLWYWTDDNGDVHLALEPPPKGQKATHVSVPAPEDPEALLALIGRATGAGKELTGLAKMGDVKDELHKRMKQARDGEQAAKRNRAEQQWSADNYSSPQPASASGQSIRTVSGGAPGLGKRH
jgi:hypothetical protein